MIPKTHYRCLGYPELLLAEKVQGEAGKWIIHQQSIQ